MKKTVKMIGMACLLGAFAFAGSSCKKNNETTSVQVSMPVVAETTVDAEKAYIDYYDDMQMKWSAGDEIMVYNLNSDYTQSEAEVYTLASGANTTVGNFHGDKAMSAEMDAGYYVFYPASKVVNYPLGPNNTQTFEVPAEQTYNGETMDPTSLVMACKPTTGTFNEFNLDHIFGFIDVRLKGNTKSVQSVELTDNAFNLTGNVSLELPLVNRDNLLALQAACTNSTVTWEAYQATMISTLQAMGYTSEPTGKSITLNCGGVQLKASEYTHFIFSLRPGCLAKGFVVKVTYTDGTSEVVNKFNPESAAWHYASSPQFPRGFSIMPGTIMRVGITLN